MREDGFGSVFSFFVCVKIFFELKILINEQIDKNVQLLGRKSLAM